MMLRVSVFALCVVAATPAFAQRTTTPAPATAAEQDDEPVVPQQPQRPLRTNQSGRLAESSVGEVGQRLTRDQAPAGIKPMARIESRIQNRVQSRLRNRIDRNYDPQANATDPFAVAEDQAKTAGRPR